MNASLIEGNVDSWNAGQYLFDRTADAGHDPGPVRLPAQDFNFRIRVYWGGYDKSNGQPEGDIYLLIGLSEEIPTKNMEYRPEDGDDDKTWRWRQKVELNIAAGESRRFSVAHRTSNGSAGNTYLRIQFLASE